MDNNTRITGFLNETDSKALVEEFGSHPVFAHIVDDIKTETDKPLLTILFKEFHE